MLELPHTIIGATIATKIGNPLLSLPLAFLSNFLLDLLPHWNPHLYTELTREGKVSKKSTLICFLDAGTALVIGLILAFRFWPDFSRVIVILSGILLAISADLIEAPFFFLGVKNKHLLKIINFQRKIQWNVPFVPGILSQAILLAFAFWLLFT